MCARTNCQNQLQMSFYKDSEESTLSGSSLLPWLGAGTDAASWQKDHLPEAAPHKQWSDLIWRGFQINNLHFVLLELIIHHHVYYPVIRYAEFHGSRGFIFVEKAAKLWIRLRLFKCFLWIILFTILRLCPFYVKHKNFDWTGNKAHICGHVWVRSKMRIPNGC